MLYANSIAPSNQSAKVNQNYTKRNNLSSQMSSCDKISFKGNKVAKGTQSIFGKIFSKMYELLVGQDKKFSIAERIFATHDMVQYGKSGIPLKYPRKDFVRDILKALEPLPAEEKAKVLAKYNLQLGVSDIHEAIAEAMIGVPDKEKLKFKNVITELHRMLGPKDLNTAISRLSPEEQQEVYRTFGLRMNIGDIDGVPLLRQPASNPIEKQIEELINKFYFSISWISTTTY